MKPAGFTISTHIRLDPELIRQLKSISYVTHDGRYQKLMRDILTSYVRLYSLKKGIPKREREAEKEILDLVSQDDDFYELR